METTIINWKDEHYISKDRITLTEEDIQIPGLRMFGTHKIQNAILPLVPHYHEDAFEFTVLAKGTMEFYTNGQLYTLAGGDVFISYPNEIHSTNNNPISLNHQYWMQVDISDPEHFFFLRPDIAADLISRLHLLQHHIVKLNNPTLLSIIKRAFSLAYANKNAHLTADLILVFLEELSMTADNDAKDHSADMERALAYIEAHCTDYIPMEDLADLCHLSVSQFKQKFRKEIGTAPREYINHQKIQHAKKMLLSGMSVTDVAMEMGFENISYFSTVFKKYTMESPKQYVTRHQRD